MKLVRYVSEGGSKIGAVVDSKIVPISCFATMRDLVESGQDGLVRVREEIAAGRSAVPLEHAMLLAPVERPGKYLAIGMNYGKHRDEAELLDQPMARSNFGSTNRQPVLPDLMTRSIPV